MLIIFISFGSPPPLPSSLPFSFYSYLFYFLSISSLSLFFTSLLSFLHPFPLPSLPSTSLGGAPPYPCQWFCEQTDCDAHQWQPALPGGVWFHWHGPSVPHWHCQPSLQPDKEPLQQHSALRPLSCEAQFHPRPTRLWLHQCQLLFCEWNTNDCIDSFYAVSLHFQWARVVTGVLCSYEGSLYS